MTKRTRRESSLQPPQTPIPDCTTAESCTVVSMGEADYKDFISQATVTVVPLAKASETGVGLRTVVDSLSAGIPVRTRLLLSPRALDTPPDGNPPVRKLAMLHVPPIHASTHFGKNQVPSWIGISRLITGHSPCFNIGRVPSPTSYSHAVCRRTAAQRGCGR